MKAFLWNQGYEAWAEHRHRQLLPSITCLLPSSYPNQGLWSLPSTLENEHGGDERDPCCSICVQRAQLRERVSVYDGFIFTANSSVETQERPSERSPVPSWWHGQHKPCLRASIPCSYLPMCHRESKDKQHHKQRLTFLLDSFPPPPKKAIWCFVYRESCHGEPACKSASTIACIKLANSWPKEPKKPWEPKNLRPSVWSGTPHVESTVPRCRGSHVVTAGGVCSPHARSRARDGCGPPAAALNRLNPWHRLSSDSHVPSALPTGHQSQVPADPCSASHPLLPAPHSTKQPLLAYTHP